MQAEYELLALGEPAVSILASLFNGQARNEFGVPYRQLGLPLRCAIEVARRLGEIAKPLEPYLLEELKNGNHIAAMALGSLGTLAPLSVQVLAQSLNGDLDLSYESARALIACGESNNATVQELLTKSPKATATFAKVSAFCQKGSA